MFHHIVYPSKHNWATQISRTQKLWFVFDVKVKPRCTNHLID